MGCLRETNPENVEVRRYGKSLGLAILLLYGLVSSSAVGANRASPCISHITVETLNIYSPEEITGGWVYRAANALHFRTKESIVRRSLLFAVGDTLVPQRLAVTERNLRSLPFIKSASITTEFVDDTTAVVNVTTQDSWTTEPSGSFGIKDEQTVYGIQLREKNLFGTGRALLFHYKHDLLRTTRSMTYRDPFLFGAYWTGEAVFSWNSDGWRKGVFLEHPFYSFTARWSLKGAADSYLQQSQIYRDGRAVSVYDMTRREFGGQLGFAIGASEQHARRLILGFLGTEDQFTHVPDREQDLIPSDRRFRYLSFGYEQVANDYLKLNYINRDAVFEDINLGQQLEVQLAISPKALGVKRTTFGASMTAQKGFRLASQAYHLTAVSCQSLWDRKPNNAIITATMTAVVKSERPVLQTTIARLQFNQGWNLDLDRQFYADGDHGLRGYRSYAFAGGMSLVGNLEQRVFSGRELLQVVSPGAAIFYDIGGAGPSGDWHALKMVSDIGAGLRLGLPRASRHNIIRIDFAYALCRDPLGRTGWLVSIESAQAF